MKAFVTTIAVAMGVALPAGNAAMAASPAYCSQQAQQYVDTYTHPAGSALLGCGAGALLGQVLTNGKGAAVIGGCAAGGATGLVLSDAKRKELYNQAYNNCMYAGNNPPPAQPVMAGPPPSGVAVVTNDLNVRQGPGTDFAVLGVLPRYSTVSVTKCQPGWCEISTSGGLGWSSSQYLSFQ